MKKILTILLFALSLTAWADRVYISPTGNDGTGDGSIATPYFSLVAAWGDVAAGDTIYLRGGTYAFSTIQTLNAKSGTAGNLINIWAYPDEQPILTRATTITGGTWPMGLVRLTNSDYVHIRGLEITGFYQDTVLASICSGLVVYRSDNCIIEQINSHHNGHGIMIYESGDSQILYCDTHHNYDPIDPHHPPEDPLYDPYGDGDGLEVTDMGVGTWTIVRGHRSWNNSDDGIDLWDSQMGVTIDSCWAWNNGYREDGVTTGGDGNGIKLGRLGNAISKPTEHLRTVTNCLSFYNRQTGFNDNLAYCIKYLYNNTAYDNNYYNYIYFNTGTSAHIVRNNISYGTPNNGAFYATSTVDHNTFLLNGANNTDYIVNDADFVSVDTVGVSGSRQTGGYLPDIDFMKLAEGSDLVDRGIIAGILFYGSAPDLGAFEYNPAAPPDPVTGTVWGTGTGSDMMVDKNGRIIIIQ